MSSHHLQLLVVWATCWCSSWNSAHMRCIGCFSLTLRWHFNRTFLKWISRWCSILIIPMIRWLKRMWDDFVVESVCRVSLTIWIFLIFKVLFVYKFASENWGAHYNHYNKKCLKHGAYQIHMRYGYKYWKGLTLGIASACNYFPLFLLVFYELFGFHRV